ncbi:hypothetical protein NK55_01425 [Thermosynechococcus sp. NK55a]|jgi:hypothetical protein|uniref:hypothetical protein n=1 Tax=Thermosynechococcus sp. NK55a TaxID=1394889 RepID=UPI0003D8B555|nr:hypothetical protein [Thermosynechococcus sp. NK55a]AHB87660.1 hypothetical protein NK55_01425 [Thermosynechococcus sp. NK55a]RMH66618.1 MAG: hypothetical protein D6676_04880 [Cyanobacteria bacterium J003]
MSEQWMRVNLVEGSVSFCFSRPAAEALRQEIQALMERMRAIARAKASGTPLAAQAAMEYQHVGEVFLEVFCNPNIWPNPYAAKVLLTVRDQRMRLMTEAELNRLVEDLNQFLESATP